MLTYLGRRFLSAIPILFLVAVVAFVLIEAVPGDPAEQVAGERATKEQVERIRTELGLDQSMPERFADYLGDLARGDFGHSLILRPGISTISLVEEAAPVTLSLTVVTLLLSALVGLSVGVLAAVRQGTKVDQVVTALMSFSLAIPPFVLGPLLVALFAVGLSWFPAIGYVPMKDGFGTWFEHLLLPCIALAINPAAELARQIRGSLVDVLGAAYVRTARAKGASPLRVVGKHALKNAALAGVTVLGLQITRIIGGAVVIESVFVLPGLGTLALNAINSSDFPVIQTLVLVSAMVVLVTNLLVDASYGYFNPKLRRTARV